ncbi:unnamed protein product (macronuclear) [Paramecium tetraurelia]|uniref:Uncharacterized protein n=1 Tax=Paramecium tetraurelia TaxID=5888 RepID=A0D264_PARTE|nr:uncharacterized protein GSPATT00012637001 [Paramecium tetraurelia]CAK77131.1 unnamed protein product [Paramecium tetraurelia]|eukprot:XP_001444528.1 hypothetical protein (macronuclear) [Paramecium tetraurelia strain d4-2]
MIINTKEPFVIVKNYRQRQQEAKKEQAKSKSIPKPKELSKKIVKPKKVNQTQQPTPPVQPIGQKLDPTLFSQLFQQHQQQQLLFQQFIQNTQINQITLQDDDLDQYSPVYLYGIPKTPQNIAISRGSTRDDDDFKI